ncbi:hypothetical protein DXG03_002052 [Asterophora parasitica]|uniref:RNase H type-1 domain-containing protein n=1 Tax=Asterophora parasitica TaxID=117018 RepID=A0A9P7G4B6_9AGAR|nr:hypothetical protein DXG03_002052 [Asterophora parasitica]
MHTVNIEWCPGHSDVKGNKRADEEAKIGALLWTPRFVTLTHAKRIAKANVLQRWMDKWTRTPPTGGFGITNQFPLAWKLRDHVKNTKREVFGRLTQCRTRHAFIGEYYAKFVPTNEIGCPCGKELQTREHVIHQGKPPLVISLQGTSITSKTMNSAKLAELSALSSFAVLGRKSSDILVPFVVAKKLARIRWNATQLKI